MRNMFKRLGLVWAALIASVIPAMATLPTEMTDLVTDATTFFGSIKTLVLTVVVFFILLGFASLIKRKR